MKRGAIFMNYATGGRGGFSEVYKRQSMQQTRVYPKVSGLAAWSDNCK